LNDDEPIPGQVEAGSVKTPFVKKKLDWCLFKSWTDDVILGQVETWWIKQFFVAWRWTDEKILVEEES